MAEDESSKDELVKAIIAAQSRKPEPPQHTDERQFAEISQADYDGFLTPDAMLDAMPYGMSNHVQIGRELRADRYRSAADEVHWAFEGFTGEERLSVLPKWIWAIAMPDAASDFWRTGYLEAWIPVGDGYALPERGNWLRIYGVKIWAPFLEAEQAAGADHNGTRDKATVKQADLQRWYEVFKAVHPNAAEALALQSAAAMFPNNHVPRQWVRDLRGPQKRGKPPTRHK